LFLSEFPANACIEVGFFAFMESRVLTPTSDTLLGRLRSEPTDQSAWAEFVRRYGPHIYRWCRQQKLQEADAQDVTQNVLCKLSARLRSFEYDSTRSFRAWLRCVARSALSDFFAEHQRRGGRSLESLTSEEAGDCLVHDLEEEFDRELMDEALARVRHRVAPHRWEAFRLTALEGLSGSEVSARLGMPVATVFTAKSKIQRLLQQEIQRLDNSAVEVP
jgi:RNA polymerase sigma factor (sigma-70 family)